MVVVVVILFVVAGNNGKGSNRGANGESVQDMMAHVYWDDEQGQPQHRKITASGGNIVNPTPGSFKIKTGTSFSKAIQNAFEGGDGLKAYNVVIVDEEGTRQLWSWDQHAPGIGRGAKGKLGACKASKLAGFGPLSKEEAEGKATLPKT